ncbi:hypothetical protein [Frankia gtarii]|uniref:hypothetical protein n=1 Tax=Frankia gtarii TaxID=2950102 RepID=UPI0021C20CF0|nr:hypothetical protein [Frankia gtarii]
MLLADGTLPGKTLRTSRIEQRSRRIDRFNEAAPAQETASSCRPPKEISPIMAVPTTTAYQSQTVLVVALCAAVSISVALVGGFLAWKDGSSPARAVLAGAGAFAGALALALADALGL